MEHLVAAVAALLACGLMIFVIIRLLFRGSVERAYKWVRPRRPTRSDIVMSELSEEVAVWHFARAALVAVLVPVCFAFTFIVVRGVLLANI